MISESLAIIPLVYLVAYAVVGGIEAGLPLLALMPHRHGRNRHGEWFSPKWELSNLLLALAVSSAVLTYAEGVSSVMPQLATLWLVIAGLMATRYLLLVAGHHTQHESMKVHWALAVVSLLLPATMVQTLTVLLTGDRDLLAHPLLTAVLGLIAVVLAVAVWAGSFYQPGTAVRELARRSYLAGVLLVAVALPLVVVSMPQLLDGRGLFAIGWPVVGAIVAGGPVLMWDHRRRYYAATIVLMAGTGLTLYNLLVPYLMRPGLRLDQATGNVYPQIAVIGVFVAMVTWNTLTGMVKVWEHLSAESGQGA